MSLDVQIFQQSAEIESLVLGKNVISGALVLVSGMVLAVIFSLANLKMLERSVAELED